MVILDASGLDPDMLQSAIRIADLTGVLFNGILGGVIARSHRLDLVGFITLAIMSALGGGMLRDTLLQQGPPVALLDYAYLPTAAAGAAIAFLIPVDERLWNRFFPYVDAVALGAWASAGSQKTLALGFTAFPAILLGTITAVGGGAMRDIVLRRVPAVLGGNTLYATPAAIASGVMVVMVRSGQVAWAAVATTAVGAGLTLLATWRGWTLPAGYDHDMWQRIGRLPRPAWRSWAREHAPESAKALRRRLKQQRRRSRRALDAAGAREKRRDERS